MIIRCSNCDGALIYDIEKDYSNNRGKYGNGKSFRSRGRILSNEKTKD